jgi:hypothetical protein
VDKACGAHRPGKDESVHPLPDPEWYLDHVLVPSGIDRHSVGPVRAWQGSWLALAHTLRADDGESPAAAAARLAVHQGFVLTRGQALECGMSDAELRRVVRRGSWTPSGRGTLAVVPTRRPDDDYAGDRRAHAVLATAAVLRRPAHTIGGASAAILHGLPTFAVPARPQLLTERPVATGRRQVVDVRRARLSSDDRDTWFGAPVTEITATIVELARHDPRSGLMAADAALHERLVSVSDLRDRIDRAAARRGIRRAREVLGLACELIESPLESLTHLALHDSGFPPPKPQVWLRGGDGKRYRVDFFWPALGFILEADGRRKYRDDALWREKNRDVALTRAGYQVARVRWADVVENWFTTAGWLRGLMDERARRLK